MPPTSNRSQKVMQSVNKHVMEHVERVKVFAVKVKNEGALWSVNR